MNVANRRAFSFLCAVVGIAGIVVLFSNWRTYLTDLNFVYNGEVVLMVSGVAWALITTILFYLMRMNYRHGTYILAQLIGYAFFAAFLASMIMVQPRIYFAVLYPATLPDLIISAWLWVWFLTMTLDSWRFIANDPNLFTIG